MTGKKRAALTRNALQLRQNAKQEAEALQLAEAAGAEPLGNTVEPVGEGKRAAQRVIEGVKGPRQKV